MVDPEIAFSFKEIMRGLALGACHGINTIHTVLDTAISTDKTIEIVVLVTIRTCPEEIIKNYQILWLIFKTNTTMI